MWAWACIYNIHGICIMFNVIHYVKWHKMALFSQCFVIVFRQLSLYLLDLRKLAAGTENKTILLGILAWIESHVELWYKMAKVFFVFYSSKNKLLFLFFFPCSLVWWNWASVNAERYFIFTFQWFDDECSSNKTFYQVENSSTAKQHKINIYHLTHTNQTDKYVSCINSNISAKMYPQKQQVVWISLLLLSNV